MAARSLPAVTSFLKLDDVVRHVVAALRADVFDIQPRPLTQAKTGMLVFDVFGGIHGLKRWIPQEIPGPVEEQLGGGPFKGIVSFTEVFVGVKGNIHLAARPG